jgi:septum formation protein
MSPAPTPPRRLILGSRSPARLAVLRGAGLDPEVVVSGASEDDVDGPPSEVVAVLAHRKAGEVARRATADGTLGDALVLGCDSVLDVDGEARSKPGGAAVARAWWRQHRGRCLPLLTGHCLLDAGRGRSAAGVATTIVRFGDPSDAEIDAYVATGEALAVAGGFTLDGLAGPFVDGIDGDPSNVLGLSLPLLRRLLAELGVALTDLWAHPGAAALPVP